MIGEVLAVLGLDDAVFIGIGAAAMLLAKRQSRVKAKFLQQHQEKIEEENQRVAEKWRASQPRKRKLVIERTFKPPVFLAPRIKIKRKFKRNPRPR